MKRLVVFISGNGTNLQTLIDAVQTGKVTAEIVAVISNRFRAFGLRRANQVGISTVCFPFRPYRETGLPRASYDARLGRVSGTL